MKIIKLMFEENLFALKQEFIPFFESLSKVFSEFVNQTSSNLFGNKPSCRQGQYQTFRLSNMLYSRIAVVCLMYCTYLFRVVYFCFKLAIVSRATTDPCFWENARIFFSFKCLFCYKKRSRLCLESYNQIKVNELLFWCVCA